MAQMIPLEDYVSQVLEPLSPLKDDRLELRRAHRRVLAEDVTAAGRAAQVRTQGP